MSQRIINQVEERIYELSINDIEKINEMDNSIGVNNVLIGLEKVCYSILYRDVNDYDLLFVGDFGKLTGYVLRTGLKEKNRNQYTYLFSRFLADKYDELDEIDSFNTFQRMTQYAFEKGGYFTISEQIGDGKGNASILLKFKKGLIRVPIIQKLDFYRDIFTSRKWKDIANENKVYLMLNIQNGLVKIGRSIKPKYRERTLQGQEAEVDIITAWIAPNETETKLKRKYKNKRTRGEWFNLNTRDLREISTYMKEFKRIKINTEANKA